MSKKLISSVYLIPISFLLTILIGAVLLSLPVSSASGESTGLLTALFTSTTSVCVTGLVVVDTYLHWSMFGQLVILILVQIGGLGVVAVGSMLMLIGKRKFSLGSRNLLTDALNVEKRRGLLSFLIKIFKGTFIVELIGAFFYSIYFVPRLGFSKGMWASLFQAVSAFCNAGMDVVGPNSMIDFHYSGLMMSVTSALIILGGLGFVVWFDVIDGIKEGIKKRMSPAKIIKRLPIHSKLVLILTGLFLLVGTVGILFTEYNNPDTIGNMDFTGKLSNSFFQSVTFRTAGFASVPQDKLTEGSCFIGYILMFIGGSPVGTAGGVKTVTAFLVFMNAVSYIKGRKENLVFNKRITEELMRKAAAIVFVSFMSVFLMTFLLMVTGGINLTDSLYEVVSALATVGLSRGLTPLLNTAGRLIIIVSMYLGRIGPISMAVFFSKGSGQENKIKHSEGKLYVG